MSPVALGLSAPSLPSVSTNADNAGIQSPQARAWEELKQTWSDFNRAIRSIEPFDQWHWIYVLSVGFGRYIYHSSRLSRLIPNGSRRKIVASVPGLSVILILSVTVSYFTRLRRIVTLERYCHNKSGCIEDYFHGTKIVYLSVMIIWNYLKSVFDSPGVALPESQDLEVSPRNQVSTTPPIGGCCGLSIPLNIEEERKRVVLYSGTSDDPTGSSNPSEFGYLSALSVKPTYCHKCRIMRPPRCHHCSVCNRCILQMDHYCPWINNCVGYNNFRSFTLTLVFLSYACWYGTFMLGGVFWEVMKENVETHGWQLLYAKTGILNLPPPWTLCYQIYKGTVSDDAMIKLVFPLLFGTAIPLTLLLNIPLVYIRKGRTAIENQAVLTWQKQQLLIHGRYEDPPNPFDKGILGNLRQLLGENLWLILLPIPVRPPAPYVPHLKDN